MNTSFTLALAPKPRVWNLRDRNIDSNLLTSLFQRILNLVSESILEIDVSANRLGTMTEEQYSSILGSLAKCPNMRIRFGYDIFIPALEKAMVSLSDTEKLRIHVDFPFESLRLAAEQVRETAVNLENERKMREETAEIPFTKAKCNEVEQQTARSIASYVNGSVVRTSYKYKRQVQGYCGDIDGLVTGSYFGRPVVVICEAKANMDGNEHNARAIKQLEENFERWQHYKHLSDKATEETPWLEYDAGNVTSKKADDIDMLALDFKTLANFDVIFALGGGAFSKSTVERVKKLQAKSTTLRDMIILISRPHAMVHSIQETSAELM